MPDPLGGFAYTWPFYVAALLGYLLGSIPFGLVLTRLAGLGDIRGIGSGNIGATNVLRTGHKGLALATLLLDGGKGALAVLVGGLWLGPDIAVLAGGGAFVGHLFPVWLRFRGGKGVATYLGVFLALIWPVGILACLTWLIVAAALRYSSLAALCAVVLTPLYAHLLTDVWGDAIAPVAPWFYDGWLAYWQTVQLGIFMAVLILLRHHANIRRLLKGEEPKIGASRRETAD